MNGHYPEIEYENADELRLEQHFNCSTESWIRPFGGPLWSVVEQSHQKGLKGQNRNIAIVDSGFDLSIKRLEDAALGACIQESPCAESRDHGTMVALLINEIAPDATLNLYEISVGGEPSGELLNKALADIARSDNDIVNLSLRHRAGAEYDGVCHCELSEAVARVSAAGKFVAAACGNQSGPVACPAALKAVLSVGYRGERREIEWDGDVPVREVAMTAGPVSPQTMLADVVVQQTPDVLGSSFATPMISGLAALSPPLEDLAHIIGMLRDAANASDITARGFADLQQKYPWEPPIQAMHALESRSFNPFYVWMTYWIYVNYSQYLMSQDYSQALKYAQKAVDFAPWNDNAWSSVAAINMHIAKAPALSVPERRACLLRAVDAYDRALAIRKDHAVYLYWRRQCQVLAGQLGE